jgi:hypothetical protein
MGSIGLLSRQVVFNNQYAHASPFRFAPESGPLCCVNRFRSLLRAREAEPSGAANPSRALGGAAADFFLRNWPRRLR